MTEQEISNCNTVLRCLPYGQKISRFSLKIRTEMSDRVVRATIELLRQQGHIIINNQNGGGYIRIEPTEKNREIIDRWVKQEVSRAKHIFMSCSHARRWLKSQITLF